MTGAGVQFHCSRVAIVWGVSGCGELSLARITVFRRSVGCEYRLSMQMAARCADGGEARGGCLGLVFAWNERNCGRTVRRFTRHAADELSELQEASLKYSGFLLSIKEAAALAIRQAGLLDGRAGRLIMAQERDDLVYLAKLAEQAERFDEMVERRRCTHIRRAAAYGGAGTAATITRNGPEHRDQRKSREGRDADRRKLPRAPPRRARNDEDGAARETRPAPPPRTRAERRSST